MDLIIHYLKGIKLGIKYVTRDRYIIGYPHTKLTKTVFY